MIRPALLKEILSEYALPLNGIHGVSHWARVLENGRRLAELTGGDQEVIELFAVFHDSKRINEGIDHGHGARGADYARKLRGKLFDVDDAAFELLTHACADHTLGKRQADLTIQVCWDSDRLDLGRAGIPPLPHLLCTAAAQEKTMIHWANERSLRRLVPDLVEAEWGLRLDSGVGGTR